ncbi:MAG: hypothetical protein K6G55_01230 [Selenomonadaceae bacterium]|nr:hypothetical protein [Selenomonadaceae bacterium]
MDGTVTLNQVINFLFIPEASISVFFLVVFLVLFIFGAWIYRKSKNELNRFGENAEMMYESVSNKMSPEFFIRKNVEKLSAREGIMEGIPDMFVSIGILATFIGLGVAIQSASDLLSDNNFEMNRLIDLLGIIAFKFQTSVWGIFFSLVFKRFIVEKHFTRKQKIIDDLRETFYEKKRDDIRTLLMTQNQILLTFAQDVEESFTEQRNDLKTIHRDISDYNENFSGYSDINIKFMENTLSYREQMAKLNSRMENFMNTFAKELRKSFVNQREDFNSVHQDILNYTNKFAEYTNINNQFVKSTLAYREEILTSNQQFEETLSEQKNILSTLLQDMSKSSTSQHNDFKGLEEKLSDYLSTNKKFMDSALKFGEEVKKFNTCVDDYHKTVSDTFNRLTDTHEELSNKQYDTLLTIRRAFGDIQKVYIRNESQYKQNIEELQKMFLTNEAKYLSEISERMRDRIDNMLKETGEIFSQTMKASIDKVSEDYNVVLESFNDKFASTIKEVNSSYTNEIQHFGNVTGDLGKVLGEINDRVENLHNELIDEQKNIGDNTLEAFGKVNKVVDAFNKVAGGQVDAVMKIYNQVNILMQNINNMNTKSVTAQEESLKQFTTTFTGAVDAMQQAQQESLEYFAERLGTLASSIENIAKVNTTEQNRILDEINSFKTNTQERQMDSADTFREMVIESLEKVLVTIQDGNDRMAEMQENSLQVMQDSLNERKDFKATYEENIMAICDAMVSVRDDLVKEIKSSGENTKNIPTAEDLADVLAYVMKEVLSEVQKDSMLQHEELTKQFIATLSVMISAHLNNFSNMNNSTSAGKMSSSSTRRDNTNVNSYKSR